MSRIWAGIVRVSDMGKRDAGGERVHTVRDQERALREALPAGAELEVLPHELDVSGGLPLERRPSLRAAVEGVESGRYAGIVVAYHSRLGRDMETEEQVWRRVEAAGGSIISALDPVDNSTSDGRLVRRIKASVNQQFREAKVEEFDRLRRNLTERGVWQARLVPVGYIKDESARLVPGPDADRVREAFEARAAGESFARIALRLGMSPSGVAGMIANRVYLGELRCGDYFNPAAHPPLVDADLWLRAQRAATVTTRREAIPVLLRGLVFCAGCGGLMSPAGSPRSYACARVRANGKKCQDPAAVNVAKLDEHVDRIARDALARIAGGPQKTDTEVARARAALVAAEGERDAFLAGVRAAEVPVEVFAESLRERQAAVDSATAALARALEDAEGVPVEWFGRALDLWDEMSVEQRNRALRRLLDGIVVQRAGGPGGGRGRRTPLGERVRVLERGSGLVTFRSGPIVLPDPEVPGVLRVDLGGDPL